MSELKARLDSLSAVPGVRLALVVGFDGFIIDASGEVSPEMEAPAAEMASAFVGCQAAGQSAGCGTLMRTIFEFAQGSAIVQRVDDAAALVLFLTPEAVVGRVRHQVKGMADELRGIL